MALIDGKSHRMLRYIPAAALIAAPAAASAAPLQPTGKWEVQYSDVACTAKRAFGDYALAFQPSPLGKTVRYVIEGPGRATGAHQFETEIVVEDGGPPIRTTSLIYPLPTKNRRAMQLIISGPEAERVQLSGRVNVFSGLLAGRRTGNQVRRQESMAVDLDAKMNESLVKALEICLADLRKHWGIQADKPVETLRMAELAPGRNGIFSSGDYPTEALNKGQSGKTNYLLMIDEAGRLLDCVVNESSGIASLDAAGCQAMLQRAKFKPATDFMGKPIKGVARFTLVWQIR